MQYIDFKESNNMLTIGGDIGEVNALIRNKSIVTCAKLNKEEIEQVVKTGVIYIKQDLHPDIPTTIIHETVLREDVIGNNVDLSSN